MAELRRSTVRHLKKYEDAALKSGAFDLQAAEDNYALPKDVMVAALRFSAGGWAPHPSNRKCVRRIKNISRLTYPDYTP